MSFIISDLSLFVAANTKQSAGSSGSSGSGSSGSRINWSMGFVRPGPGYTVPGTWMEDVAGWRYRKADGNDIKSSWARINGLWYYFNENGYMMTGWITYNGRRFYLEADGSMAVSTVTPDGFKVGAVGAVVQE